MGVKTYIEETVDELVHKVSWPTWNELQSSAIVVMIASAIIALIVLVMDLVFGINQIEGGWKGILGFFYSILR